jgi:hypothetical protein
MLQENHDHWVAMKPFYYGIILMMLVGQKIEADIPSAIRHHLGDDDIHDIFERLLHGALMLVCVSQRYGLRDVCQMGRIEDGALSDRIVLGADLEGADSKNCGNDGPDKHGQWLHGYSGRWLNHIGSPASST